MDGWKLIIGLKRTTDFSRGLIGAQQGYSKSQGYEQPYNSHRYDPQTLLALKGSHTLGVYQIVSSDSVEMKDFDISPLTKLGILRYHFLDCHEKTE